MGISNPTEIEIKFDKTLNVQNNIPGPKFLILSHAEKNQTMRNVSPFLVEKVINSIDGKVEMAMLPSGSISIKTENIAQADKIIKLIQFPNGIKVTITENVKRNSCKGVIYAPELLSESDEDIVCYLKKENVVEVQRLTVNRDGVRKETGTFFITFGINVLPEFIYCGYMKYKIRQFIPSPTQCFACGKFWHTAKFCRNMKRCLCCGEAEHLQNKEQRCENLKKCINCSKPHETLNRRECPEYKRQVKINEIRILQKLSYKEAEYALRNSVQERLICTSNQKSNVLL